MAAKSENIDKLDKLTEYMEKKFGITQDNIDEKLAEMRKKFCGTKLERGVGR